MLRRLALVLVLLACEPAPEPLASWGTAKIERGELEAFGRRELEALAVTHARERFALERRLLEQLLEERLLAEAARAEGLPSGEALIAREVGRQPPITDEDMRRFHAEKLAGRGIALAGKEAELKDHMARTRAQAVKRQVVEAIRRGAKVTISHAPPKVPVERFELAGRPIRGDAGAPITIVEFGDLTCSACASAAPRLAELVERSGGKARLALLHAPNPGRPWSRDAAVLAECAGQQGQFWAMHDKLLADLDVRDEAGYAGLAAAIGLDAEKLSACRADSATKQRVADDEALADRLGVKVTPTYFVNGVRVDARPEPADLIPFLLGFGG